MNFANLFPVLQSLLCWEAPDTLGLKKEVDHTTLSLGSLFGVNGWEFFFSLPCFFFTPWGKIPAQRAEWAERPPSPQGVPSILETRVIK